mgnify:CR=1 FL=1
MSFSLLIGNCSPDGANGGWSAPIDTSKGHLDDSSVKLHRTVSGGYYAHSNDWIPINNSEPTVYKFSGWVYLESSGYSWARLVLFMNENEEDSYYTEVNPSARVYTKNQWVYLEQEVTVSVNIDKINLRVDLYNNSPSVTAWFDELRIEKMESSEIVEENNYYPFGLEHKGYNNVTSANVNSAASKFKYNGVEFEESLGLNLYEMDMRQYDPAIARWTSIDPVTHFSMSTYTAFDNNPIYWSDPSGADSEDYYGDPPDRKGEREEVYFDEDGMAWAWDDKLNEWINHSNLDEIIVSNSNTDNSGNSGMASIYSSLDSEADRSWFDDHPEHEEPIRAAANRAGLAEFFRAGTIGNDDGYGDALRHAYWSYLITKELGPKVAKAFTDNHEDISGSNNLNEPRGLMDLNNNAWGINLATSGKPVNMVNSFTEYFNRAVISGDIDVQKKATIPANLDERIESTQRASEWALKYGERE